MGGIAEYYDAEQRRQGHGEECSAYAEYNGYAAYHGYGSGAGIVGLGAGYVADGALVDVELRGGGYELHGQ